MDQQHILSQCKQLLQAYQEGKLGYMKMPEDENPWFDETQREEKICYFTLPMALNYQRNSYKLRESALATWNDPITREVFNIQTSFQLSKDQLREKLMKYKVALQPNKHIDTRSTISTTIATHWGDITTMLDSTGYDFLALKTLIQNTHKKGFPYISGPKIFNYWSYILQSYWGIPLKNTERIEIAPDTHVIQCSIKLGVINAEEAKTISREKLSEKRRDLLANSGITPIEMHSPLRFRSRNNFQFDLTNSK